MKAGCIEGHEQAGARRDPDRVLTADLWRIGIDHEFSAGKFASLTVIFGGIQEHDDGKPPLGGGGPFGVVPLVAMRTIETARGVPQETAALAAAEPHPAPGRKHVPARLEVPLHGSQRAGVYVTARGPASIFVEGDALVYHLRSLNNSAVHGRLDLPAGAGIKNPGNEGRFRRVHADTLWWAG